MKDIWGWLVVLMFLVPLACSITVILVGILNIILKDSKWIDWRDFIITRVAGKMLIFTGIVASIINPVYDRIVTRPVVEFGPWQWVAEIWFFLMIGVGWILNDFTKDLGE